MNRIEWRQRLGWMVCVCLVLGLIGCGRRKDVNRNGEIKLRGEKPVATQHKEPGDLLQKGEASWYGYPYHGRKTANGETYDMNEMTAAHKTLPFHTRVRVVDPDTDKEVEVRINDRGPFVKGRIIDLSREAAKRLGLIGKGTGEVHLFLAEGNADTNVGTVEPRQSRGDGEGPSRQIHRRPRGEVLWTIQVGSFSTESAAESFAKRLDPYTNRVWIKHANGMFRVRAGAFTLRADAEEFANLLQEEGFSIWLTTFD